MGDVLGIAIVKEICVICSSVVEESIIMNSVLSEENAEEIKKAHNQIIGYAEEACKDCKEMMAEHLLIIPYNEDKSDLENLPGGFFRTGQIIGILKGSEFVKDVHKEFPRAKELGYIFIEIKTLIYLGIIKEN